MGGKNGCKSCPRRGVSAEFGPFSGGSYPIDDGGDLARGEGFAFAPVAHGLEFVPEHVVAADEGHEAVDSGVGDAVGEVEEGQFFFGVGADVHGCFF